MNELGTYRQMPAGGVVVADRAPRPDTGGWRLGRRPAVDLGRCVNCLLCWAYCPDCAILLVDETTFFGFEYDLCKGCEICAVSCPTGAITMQEEEMPLPRYGRMGGSNGRAR